MIKDILVYLDRTAHASVRLEVAAALAARAGAVLIGLRVEVHPHVPKAFRAGIPREALDAQAAAIAADTARIARMFQDTAQCHGVTAEWWLDTAGGVDGVCERARHAGLALVGPPEADHEEELPADRLVHHLLLTAGRPVMVVPDRVAVAVPGSRIAVAWDGSREASRAVADALPLLVAAQDVLVFTIDRSADGGLDSLGEIGRHLERHGVKVRTRALSSDGRTIGDRILAETAGADMLVMGAYGHSRLHEVVLGGATRHILAHTVLPVLLSH